MRALPRLRQKAVLRHLSRRAPTQYACALRDNGFGVFPVCPSAAVAGYGGRLGTIQSRFALPYGCQMGTCVFERQRLGAARGWLPQQRAPPPGPARAPLGPRPSQPRGLPSARRPVAFPKRPRQPRAEAAPGRGSDPGAGQTSPGDGRSQEARPPCSEGPREAPRRQRRFGILPPEFVAPEGRRFPQRPSQSPPAPLPAVRACGHLALQPCTGPRKSSPCSLKDNTQEGRSCRSNW